MYIGVVEEPPDPKVKLKVKHEDSLGTLLWSVSPSLTHLTKFRKDPLRIMRPEVELND